MARAAISRPRPGGSTSPSCAGRRGRRCWPVQQTASSPSSDPLTHFLLGQGFGGVLVVEPGAAAQVRGRLVVDRRGGKAVGRSSWTCRSAGEPPLRFRAAAVTTWRQVPSTFVRVCRSRWRDQNVTSAARWNTASTPSGRAFSRETASSIVPTTRSTGKLLQHLQVRTGPVQGEHLPAHAHQLLDHVQAEKTRGSGDEGRAA